MYSYYFTISALFFDALLFSAYFYKKRVKRIENIFYSGVIITSLLGLIAEAASAYLVLNLHIVPSSLSYQLIVKAIYAAYLFWVTFIFLYFVSLLFIYKHKKIYNVQIAFLIMSILNIAVLFLPVEAVTVNDMLIPVGPCIIFSDILAITYILSMLIIVFKNHNLVKRKERVPLVCTFVVFFLDLYLQFFFQLFLTHSFSAIVAFIMYFTIQNPDIKMLEEVEIEKNRANKANMAKTDFLSSMSHEIRTPLNAIVGFSEGLKEEQLSDSAKEAVDDIISASQTLLETVNGILDISKIEANKIEIINSEYNFDQAFNDLVALSKARLGHDKPIEFKYHKAENVPKYLYGDCARIKQVIVNLLTNAIKYTNKGQIIFDVSAVNTEEKSTLTVKVEDTGMGIKEENIGKLFSKFERLDNENSGIEGTGLGLAITKRLVEMMGGKILVQSKYGVGSTFTFIVDQKIVKNPILEKNENNDEITIINDLSNKKVLLVDDNNLNLKVARNLLKAYNIVPEETTSGVDCLYLINRGKKYDLVLLDDMMPGKSGKETFNELKKDPNFNIPVVILTANAVEGMKEEYLNLGFNDYLSKPIDKKELKRILKEYLDK